jgi:ribosomal protein L7/L12
MPHTWYKAVCDEHKEYCDCLVTSSFHVRTCDYLRDDQEQSVMSFLGKHYACKLRLVHSDGDLDGLFDDGYKDWLKNEPEAPPEPVKEAISGERFEVWLRTAPEPVKQIPLIKAIRGHTPLGLKDAMGAVKAPPIRLFTFASHHEAHALAVAIMEHGAKAEIVLRS